MTRPKRSVWIGDPRGGNRRQIPRPKRAKLVPCYALTAPGLLTAEQLEAVRPFLRETFSETFRAMMSAHESANIRARLTLVHLAEALAGDNRTIGYDRDGRAIEERLYRHAVALNLPPVMHVGRRGVR